MVRLLLFYALLVVSLPLLAANWFVATTGSDAAEGHINAPLRSLAESVRRAQPGDTVYIRGGIYRESLAPNRSGTVEHPIVFSRYGSERAIIDATGLHQGVMLWNVSDIVVRGLEVRNAERVGMHIHHHKDTPARGADRIVFEQNSVYDNHSHGIYVGGTQNKILYNSVYNNGELTPKRKGHGIYVLGTDNLVASNNVHHNRRLGIRMAGERQQILNNLIEANDQDGIGVWVDRSYRGEDLLFEGNKVLFNQGNGIHISGDGDGYKPSRVQILQNTVKSDHGAGIVLWGGVRQVKLGGNKVSGPFEYFLKVDRSSTERVFSDHNQFQGLGHFYFSGREYSSLQEYQRAAGMDVSSTYRK